MNILVVLAVAAVFGLLRFRRANLLMWAVAWWVGIYVLLRFGFTAPIPASVVSLYMGIVSIAILAYVSSSEERREEVSGPLVRFMTEKRYTRAPRRHGRRHPGARGRERLRPDERPARASALPANGPSCVADRDHGSRQEDRSRRRREPLPGSSRRRIRKSSASMSRTGAGSTTGTASSATATTWPATACSCTGWTRSRPTSPTRARSRCLRDTFLFWRISKGGPGLPEEGGPWDTAMPAWEKFLKEDEIWEAILFLYDFTGQKPRAREEAAHAMTSRLIGPRALGCLAVLIAVVCVPRRRDRCARRVPTSGPRRSGSRARRSTSSTARSATARRGTAKATPRRICCPRPRNFTTGKFKVRTTPNGALPTHQDLVNIIRRGMPYTSMPAWPNLSDQEVSDLAYFITTFSARLRERRECPEAGGAPERAGRHERVHRAREEALRGDRLRQVPRHARSGRRTFGADAEGRLGPSDTRGGPRAELDLPGRVVPRGYLPDDEHGVQRHADAVVRSTPSRPSSDGRSPTSSSRSRGATGLAIPTSSSPSTSRIRSI